MNNSEIPEDKPIMTEIEMATSLVNLQLNHDIVYLPDETVVLSKKGLRQAYAALFSLDPQNRLLIWMLYDYLADKYDEEQEEETTDN